VAGPTSLNIKVAPFYVPQCTVGSLASVLLVLTINSTKNCKIFAHLFLYRVFQKSGTPVLILR